MGFPCLLWVPWVDLVSFESLWGSMGSSIVPLWGSMGLSMGAVGFCGCYGAYGLTWSPLDLYEALYGRYGLLWVPWVDLVSFGSLWGSHVCYGSHGLTWSPLNPYGALWVLL